MDLADLHVSLCSRLSAEDRGGIQCHMDPSVWSPHPCWDSHLPLVAVCGHLLHRGHVVLLLCGLRLRVAGQVEHIKALFPHKPSGRFSDRLEDKKVDVHRILNVLMIRTAENPGGSEG